jgi:Crinkler effector protein N-terminal domain
MTEVEFELWYYIQGQPGTSYVSILPNKTIAHLREEIYNKTRNIFMELRCDAQRLSLRKVRYIMISVNTHVINGLCWLITPGRSIRG